MTKIIKSEQYKEYYFYKQEGFYAEKRKEIPLKFKPFDIIRHYEPLNFSLPTVTDEQIEKCKQHIINEAKKKSFTLKYTDEDYHYLTQCKEIKKEAEYFLIGKFNKINGEISTLKNGFVYKYLAVLDYEYLTINTKEFYELIHSKLSKYSYMIYKSVSYTEVHPRFRVIVDTSREMNEGENLATLKNIVELIGIEPDPLSFTYNQIQGLPLIINGGDYEPIVNHGEPYPVQEAVKQENKIKPNYTASNVQNNNILVSDEAFKSMFERYLVIDYENIKPGTPNEYNKILTILLALSRDVCYKVISYEVACECSDMLADIGATPEEYKQGNLDKINHAINCWKSNPNYFESEKSYSMLDKFKIIGDEELKNEAKSYSTFSISSNDELFKVLSEIGDKWRNEHTIVNEKTGKKTVPIMKFYTIAKILLENVPIKKSGVNEEITLLYYYDYSKGIYTTNEDYIKACVKKVEFRYKLTKLKDITEDLRANTRFENHYRPEHLIAVGNGLFNEKTKELEPFDPKHFITAKVDTNYNPYAIVNYEKIKDTYFNYDKWLSSIACGDPEVITLLWQLKNEALNPNKTRRRIAIMLGGGTNGKSTFRELLINLIGKNKVSVSTPHELQLRFGLYPLEGKICNYGDEVGTKPLDEIDKLKSISSGESINYERKGEDMRNYDFKTLLLFNSNGIPPIKEKTEAVLDRLLIIPFKANFNGKADKSIKNEKLKNKVILEYVLYKALHLEFEEFIIPEIVKEEIEKFKSENDSIYSYMLQYIDNDYHNISCIPISSITEKYEEYCEDNGYKPRQRIGKQFETHLNNKFKNNNYKYEVRNHRFSEVNTEELHRYCINIKPLEGKVKSALKQIIIKND